nr:MAG TPA_asm: hypothetical protein [Caudoviricetes sp.]
MGRAVLLRGAFHFSAGVRQPGQRLQECRPVLPQCEQRSGQRQLELPRSAISFLLMHCATAAENSSRRRYIRRPSLRGKLIQEPASW